MTLREKIFKTFVVTIREINTHGGPEEFFKKYPAGGMYYAEGELLLNDKNEEIGTSMRVETLENCKKAAAKDSANSLLICADGAMITGQKMNRDVQRSLAASENPGDAYELGRIIGMQMNDKGIDWVLGPSIDMCLEHTNYLMAITDEPKQAAKIYREVVRGIQDQGVCATAKHFPGLGTSFINMHIGPGENRLPFDQWMETYGFTYEEMFKEDVMSVMTTHATLRSYDNEITDGFYPIATYSKKLTQELLKDKLGFKGAVVTDALIMGGMATGDLVKETVQAFKAGADLLLWPPVEAAEAIEEAILNGEIPMSRLDDALARIERMESFRKKALEEKNYDTPDAEYADNKLLEIAKSGMCLLRNEKSLIPLNPEKQKKVLIIDVADREDFSAVLLREELIKRGFEAEIKKNIYDEPSRVCWQADIDALQEKYDLVIFNVDSYFAAEWSSSHMLIWASHLFSKEKKVIINYQGAFFATDYFPEDPTFIEMNCAPSKETVELLVDGLLGKMKFKGKNVLKQKL